MFNRKSSRALTLFVALGLAFSLRADSVTSVSCSTPTAPYQTGLSSCSAFGSYGYSQAAVSASVTLPSSATDATLIETSLTTIAAGYGTHGLFETSTAQASSDVQTILDTTGPVRSGALELNFLQTAWQTPSNGSISETLQIGGYSVSPDGSNLSTILIPIQLGTEFGFDLSQTLASIGSSGSGITSGDIGSEVSLLAFESDWTTPVQLFDPPGSAAALLAPEPASVGLMGISLLAVAWLLKRRR